MRQFTPLKEINIKYDTETRKKWIYQIIMQKERNYKTLCKLSN